MAREICRPEFYSHLRHQLSGVTLGPSLKLSGPSFHLKHGGDDTCTLTGIVRRIREIRKIHRAPLIPSELGVRGGRMAVGWVESSQEKMNPGRSNSAIRWLLTSDIALLFCSLCEDIFIQFHIFFPSTGSPPSDSRTHPPTQIALLARCPTRHDVI